MKRLFKLTKREYYADFLITPPLTVGLLVHSALHGIDALWFAQLLIGLFVWTFYEYAVHRWILHGWMSWFHDWHHDDQRDYIALHPILTLLLYGASWLIFGPRYSIATLGFSIGYVLYAALHTAFHYATIKNGHPLFNLKRRHALHHAVETTNYGVLTSLWDRLFRTEWRRG